MPSTPATRRTTPADRAAVPPASTAGQYRHISLVVVRDGVAETSIPETPRRDAFNPSGMAATRLDPGTRPTGPAPLLSVPSPEQLDQVDDPARSGEAADSLLAEIVHLLPDTSRSSNSEPQPFHDELTSAEARVLRYLPTNLTAWEIAEELYVTLNTVKTHMRHIYAKLGAHRRREAVERARAFGLLAPSSHLRPGRQALA